jgi:hypothetical protein
VEAAPKLTAPQDKWEKIKVLKLQHEKTKEGKNGPISVFNKTSGFTFNME